MNLRLQNSWEYQPDDSWAWTAFLTGADLPKVKSVQYLLHPSYSHPVRQVDDPRDNFSLSEHAFTPFDLTAIVHTTDGRREILRHKVKLETQPVKGRTDAA